MCVCPCNLMADEVYSHTQTNLAKGSNYTQSLSNPMLFPRQPPVESGWASIARYLNIGSRRMADLTSKICEVSSHVWDYAVLRSITSPAPLPSFGSGLFPGGLPPGGGIGKSNVLCRNQTCQ